MPIQFLLHNFSFFPNTPLHILQKKFNPILFHLNYLSLNVFITVKYFLDDRLCQDSHINKCQKSFSFTALNAALKSIFDGLNKTMPQARNIQYTYRCASLEKLVSSYVYNCSYWLIKATVYMSYIILIIYNTVKQDSCFQKNCNRWSVEIHLHDYYRYFTL